MPKPYIVVLRQLGGIGDALMMSPVFRGLKERYQNHDIVLATSNNYPPEGVLPLIASRNPYIDRIEIIDERQWTSNLTKIRHELFDAELINKHPLVAHAAGFVDLNTICASTEARDARPPHRTDIWCSYAQVNPIDRRPIYHVRKKERLWAQALLKSKDIPKDKPIIGVSLTSTDQARVLNGAVIRMVLKRLDAAGYFPITIDRAWTVPGWAGIVGMGFNESVAIISLFDGFVANDSGLLHVAGTVRTPLVGVFGSIPSAARMKYYDGIGIDSPLNCAPCWYAKPCLQSEDSGDHFECMKNVSSEQIVNAVKRLVPF